MTEGSDPSAFDPETPETASEEERGTPPPRTGVNWESLIKGGLAVLAGVLLALAFPPFGFLPGLAGYPLLLLLSENAQDRRAAFGLGWLAGFAYFLIGCWWVAEAFLVFPQFAWMAVPAACLLPAGIALFWGAACAVYRWVLPSGVFRVLVFAGLFSVLEWLRGHVLTGFPWNPAGAVWPAGSPPSQFAAYVGVYGLGLVTVAAAVSFAPLFGPGPRKARAGKAVAGALLLLSLFVVGSVRLGFARIETTDTVVRVVQPDVAQESKWTAEAFRDIVNRYVNLTARSGAETPSVVIWPEGALPISAEQTLAPANGVAPAIASALEPGQTLLLGTYREGASRPGAEPVYHNSLIGLRREATGLRVTATYDKNRLVPFGEYLPGGGLLRRIGLTSLSHMVSDFSPGPRPAPIALPDGSRVQPLICYESLYPALAHPSWAQRLAGRAPARAGWIANISNDAWFGPTSGPRQHLNLAAYRAIEEGVPLVRATPTGISAVIDPWGRVVDDHRLEPGESGTLDAALPRPLAQTPYGLLGDLPYAVMLLAFLLFVLRRGKGRSETEAGGGTAVEDRGEGTPV